MNQRIYLSPPHVQGPERELLLDALDSNWIAPLGPHVDAFEREFGQAVSMPPGAALSSGTAALHLALVMLGVKPGDTVICPTLTFAATANVIKYVGAEPIFIDCDRETWTIDPDLLGDELHDSHRRGCLPKAVITVDIYGQCADYGRILEVCDAHGVPVVEDAAEALGASYRSRPAGSFGAAAAFSFNGNKIITTSGGGMLVSRDPAFVSEARFLASQARDPAPHYQHSKVGFNYRLSNLLAAVGRAQLQSLEQRVNARRAINQQYRHSLAAIPGIQFMPEAPYGRSTNWLTCVTIDESEFGTSPDALRLSLEAANIEARPVWKPMHLQPVFTDARSVAGDVARSLFETGLCLPSGSAMTSSDMERVLEVIYGVARR